MKKSTAKQRQLEIAAESFAVCLLARAGYDVFVQYGRSSPLYHLVAFKGDRQILINVQVSTDGSWPIAVHEDDSRLSHSEAIQAWFKQQRGDVIFLLVQFQDVELTVAPRVHVATADELRIYLLGQNSGEGDTRLWEDYRRGHPRSRRGDKLPAAWRFSQIRIDIV